MKRCVICEEPLEAGEFEVCDNCGEQDMPEGEE